MPSDNKTDETKITAKRKLLLDNALRLMRRKRNTMEQDTPGMLDQIKSIVVKNPKVATALGFKEQGEQKKEQEKMTAPAPAPPPTPTQTQNTAKVEKKAETIDQAHNMEVLAKLMTLKPDGRDNIKKLLQDTQDQ